MVGCSKDLLGRVRRWHSLCHRACLCRLARAFLRKSVTSTNMFTKKIHVAKVICTQVYGRLTGEGTGIPHNSSEKGELERLCPGLPRPYSGYLFHRKATCRKPNTVPSNSGCRGEPVKANRLLALLFIFQTATKMASKVALCPELAPCFNRL